MLRKEEGANALDVKARKAGSCVGVKCNYIKEEGQRIHHDEMR